MKKKVLLAISVMALLCGCATTPIVKRYTVFSAEMMTSKEPLVVSKASGLRLRMAEDLRAYNMPLCFHADGTVTPYRAMQYYAPLEVALKRALEDTTLFLGTSPEKTKIIVRDYCIVERPTPQDGHPAGFEVRVTLQVTDVDPSPKHRTASVYLTDPTPTPQQIRDAFATALHGAYAPQQECE